MAGISADGALVIAGAFVDGISVGGVLVSFFWQPANKPAPTNPITAIQANVFFIGSQILKWAGLSQAKFLGSFTHRLVADLRRQVPRLPDQVQVLRQIAKPEFRQTALLPAQ